MSRSLLSFILLFLLAFFEGPIFAKVVVSKINVIPVPKSVKMLKNGGYKITDSTKIIVSEKTYNVGKYLAQLLRPATGFKLKIVKESKKYFKKGGYENENAIVLITEARSKKYAKEGYSFRSDRRGVVIRARTTRGVFYGCQTLRHLLPGAIESKIKVDGVRWDVPATEINDKPRFSYRGMHLDVGRHFMKTEKIKKYIDYLAMYKINYFHWHLTEDQGWRIEIKKYPKLTEISAWRDQTIIDGKAKYDGKRYGGFYTQKEIRDIVAYARERFITVVPEIELPGHTSAVLAAYPELGCTGGPYEVRQRWGISRDVFCAGNEKVYDFLQGVFEEVLQLFPSEYIHIGGDECPKDRWKKCPKCQKRIKEEKLGDEKHLQSYFVNRIGRFLEKKGRKFIGWDEILEGSLSPSAIVMSWRGERGGIEAARRGHKVIMTPRHYCYFDYYQSLDPQEPLAHGGFLPLEKVYSYNPIPAVLSGKEGKRILGAQANVWTEHIRDFKHVEYMIFPRLCALAEVVWSQPSNKNFSDFSKRLSSHITHLNYLNVNYRFPSPTGLKERYTFKDGEGVKINLIPFPVDGTVHYTTDGSQPTKDSPIFKGPMTIKKSMILKARNVTKTGRMSITTTSTFRKLVMKKASKLKLTDVKRGLKFSYYDEIQKKLRGVPNFSKLKAKRVGVQAVFRLPPEIRSNFFAINFEGYIKVPSDGTYTFYTRSDDGSLLYIGDEKIVDNDGLHGAGNLVSGQVLLKKGFHKIRVGYFQASGGKSIKVVYEGPGINRQAIPSTILFHK